MSSIIVQGSARSKGNSHQIATLVQQYLNADIIDLAQKDIHPYTYDHQHIDDDFIPTLEQIIKYDTIVFITPVYWYAMSGLMKNFFDRITDCLKVKKEIGRQLRGKKMIAIACGSDSTQTEGFFVPFENSAAYLGMEYIGHLHTWISDATPTDEVIKSIEDFFEQRVNHF